MPGGRVVRCAAAAVPVALLLALGAPIPAAASTPEPSGGPPARAAVRELTARIAALQQDADRSGVVAQKANEAYLDAKADAADARSAADDAEIAAVAAEATAKQSRARAAIVAARLARTDFGTLPLDLMLNRSSADHVLGGLSNAGQLAAESHRLYRKAADDDATARTLQAVSRQRSAEADRQRQAAASAYRDARHRADDAKQDVAATTAREAALLTRIAEHDGVDVPTVCAELQTASQACATPAAPSGTLGDSTGDRVVAFARGQIGDPYVFAAAGPDSWDCSGITLGAYRSVGIPIGIHSATAQYRTAEQQGDLVPVAAAEPGDLLFYSDGGGDIYHVTIYSGDGMMIEAPYPGVDVREVPVRTADLVAEAAHFD